MVELWPEGCKAAVSLTFDDGLDVHLDRVVPRLDKYGLLGTFYILPRGENWRAELEKWRPAATTGHELGNHSISHMGPAALWGREPRSTDLEVMTLSQVEDDIMVAEERFSQVFPDKRRSYCYPCYSMFVGAGPTHQSYVPVVAKHFAAARSTGEFGYNYPKTCDLHTLASWRGEHTHAEQLIGKAEMAITRGTWDVFTFHGLGDGGLSVNTTHFERFVQHLAARKNEIWVAPVIDVASRIIEWRKES